MTTKFMKLLGATTALVALAGTSHAAAGIATSTTTQLLTSTTTGGIQVLGTGSISVTAGPAIAISSTSAADNTISVSTGGIIRASGADAVISSSLGAPNTSNSAITINNSGTIAAVGTATKAIDLSSGAQNGNTINNNGTISGTVTMSGNNDTINATGGIFNGAVDMGAGANVATLSNTTVTGNWSGGGGADTLSLTNSTVTGAVSLGAGANTVTINNSTVNAGAGAAYTGGANVDILTVTNGTISGTMDFAGGNDAMYVSGTQAFTTKGAITGLEQLGVSNTTMNVRNSISGLTAVDINSTGRVNVSNSLSMSGALTNAGIMEIAAGTNVTAATMANGGRFILDLGSSRTIGTISTTGAASTIANTSYTISVGANSGYIASGTQFNILNNTTSATTTFGALTSNQTGVYRFNLGTDGAGGVSLTVGRVATAAVTGNETSDAIGNVLDNLGANASGTLVTVQSVIGQQTSAAGVEEVVESLAPNIDGVGAANVGFSTATGNLVSNRLASLRNNKNVVTGDAMANNHMWVEGFGTNMSQDDHKGQKGYDATSAGATFGLDTDTLVEGMTTGAAFSYGHGTVDSNAAGGASTDIDSYLGTLYGSQVMEDGTFINGQVGLGLNNYDSERTVLGIGKATADFDGWQASAKAEAGKDFAVSGFTLTPLVGLQYTYLDIDSYTETGAGGASLRVNPDSMGAFDASAGGQVAYAMPMENGGIFKPNLHAKYIYRMGDTNLQTTSNFTGGGSTFATNGVKMDRSGVNLGTGLLLTTAGGVDFSVNYDADLRSNLVGHSGQVKARWAF